MKQRAVALSFKTFYCTGQRRSLTLRRGNIAVRELIMTSRLLQSVPEAPAPGRVLVVDTDELVREYLTLILEFAGYPVVTTDCAEQALQAFDAAPCSIVIAEREMPGIDGLSLCRCIRARRTPTHTYLLLFAVRADSRDVATAREAGVDDYLIKGIPVWELLARLDRGSRVPSSRPQQRWST